MVLEEKNVEEITKEMWIDILSKKDKYKYLNKNRGRIIASLRKGIPDFLRP